MDAKTCNFTPEQIEEAIKPLGAIKSQYAKEVVKFLESLPAKHRQIVYLYARDTAYEISMALLQYQCDQRKKEKEVEP